MSMTNKTFCWIWSSTSGNKSGHDGGQSVCGSHPAPQTRHRPGVFRARSMKSLRDRTPLTMCAFSVRHITKPDKQTSVCQRHTGPVPNWGLNWRTAHYFSQADHEVKWVRYVSSTNKISTSTCIKNKKQQVKNSTFNKSLTIKYAVKVNIISYFFHVKTIRKIRFLWSGNKQFFDIRYPCIYVYF